jgi:hypothetical protein
MRSSDFNSMSLHLLEECPTIQGSDDTENGTNITKAENHKVRGFTDLNKRMLNMRVTSSQYITGPDILDTISYINEIESMHLQYRKFKYQNAKITAPCIFCLHLLYFPAEALIFACIQDLKL